MTGPNGARAARVGCFPARVELDAAQPGYLPARVEPDTARPGYLPARVGSSPARSKEITTSVNTELYIKFHSKKITLIG